MNENETRAEAERAEGESWEEYGKRMGDRLSCEMLPTPKLENMEDVRAYLEGELPDSILCLGELSHAGVGRAFVDGALRDLMDIGRGIARLLTDGRPVRFAEPEPWEDCATQIGEALSELAAIDYQDPAEPATVYPLLAKALKQTLERRKAREAA